MVILRKSTTASATVFLLLALTSTPQQASSSGIGRVLIGNGFGSPTVFTCHSDLSTRPSYSASRNEIYYFVFDTMHVQFWDCQVVNVGYAKSGTFRFWGDDSHGGPELFSCSNCQWSVDQFGISLYTDSQWRYHYSWNHADSSSTSPDLRNR